MEPRQLRRRANAACTLSNTVGYSVRHYVITNVSNLDVLGRLHQGQSAADLQSEVRSDLNSFFLSFSSFLFTFSFFSVSPDPIAPTRRLQF